MHHSLLYKLLHLREKNQPVRKRIYLDVYPKYGGEKVLTKLHCISVATLGTDSCNFAPMNGLSL